MNKQGNSNEKSKNSTRKTIKKSYYKPRPKRYANCEQCGEKYHQLRRNGRFCSKYCNNKWRRLNLESVRQYHKEYYKTYEVDVEGRKTYYQNNKENFAKRQRERREKMKLTCWIVYGLPYDMYAGITNIPDERMFDHMRKIGRDTDEWFVLDVCLTESEAREREKYWHSNGWRGEYTEKLKTEKQNGQ